MEKISSQTEKLTTFETSRTRLSLEPEDTHNNDSNNDEDYALSGFYVREKNLDKTQLEAEVNTSSSDDATKDNAEDTENSQDDPEKPQEIMVNGKEETRDNDEDKANEKDEVETETTLKNTEETKNDDICEDENDTESLNKDPNLKDIEVETESTLKNSEETKNDDICEETKGDDICEETKGDDICEETKGDDICEEKGNTEILNKDPKNVEEKLSTEMKSKEIDETNETDHTTDTEQTQSCNEEEPNLNESDERPSGKENEMSTNRDCTQNCEGNEKPLDTDEDDIFDESEIEKTKEKIDTGNDQANVADREVEKNADNKIEVNDNGGGEVDANSKETEVEDDTTDAQPDCQNDANSNEANSMPSSSKDSAELFKENEVDVSQEPTEIVEKKSKSKRKIKPVKKKSKSRANKRIKVAECDESESNASILKEHLEKPIENDDDMDEDFDPSLLCPDISMDIDEAPVITNDENGLNDGSTSPLPYEPIFSELVDEITGTEVQVDLTPEEMEIRKKTFGPKNQIQFTKIHCTACNVHLGSALMAANNRFVHPLLKVLICKDCYHFYTSGEFEKDEDGSELYCRWCGQGGQVLCCSSCEYVFCKRCIRNNFGPRKFKQIRDSDDWNCFRCNPSQLSYLRASCAEFMEYYMQELTRVQNLTDQPELMTTDYSRCCNNSVENKSEEQKPPQPKIKRKRKESDDPDYQPIIEEDIEPPQKKVVTVPTPTTTASYAVVSTSSLQPLPRLVPKSQPSAGVRQILIQQTQSSKPIFKIGNVDVRPRTSVPSQRFTLQRPSMIQNQAGPGFFKIVPHQIRAPTTLQTAVAGSSKPIIATVRPAVVPRTNGAPIKHDWFEKTVRASARVNSNLSYTLTQLNRQQSQASNVETLALIHNKLQELLSTSINSLIQIRKNLRTEFIAGIKNIKFPPKNLAVPSSVSTVSKPIVVKDDDDVIFVNPAAGNKNQIQTLPSPPPLVFSPAVTLSKKSTLPKQTSDEPKPSTSVSTNSPLTVPKGGFLKVRSFSALQNVTSECITIPDDPPVLLTSIPDEEVVVESDPLVIITEEKNKNPKHEAPKQRNDPIDINMVYNVNTDPSPQIKKMMEVVVYVEKSSAIDEVMRARKSENLEITVNQLADAAIITIDP